MVSFKESSSFLAYAYESDEENDDEECFLQLCGCHDEAIDDESESKTPTTVDETTRLFHRKTISENRARAVRSQRSQDKRLVGSVAIVLFMLIVCEYYFLAWKSGTHLASDDASIADSGEPFVLNQENDTAFQYTSSTEYGEVWLIRHGEKESVPHFASGQTDDERRERIHAMYELSSKGWKRANHLAGLVQQGKWPLFSSLFASRPATQQQVQEAYPDFARDATGQSLVRREYQTVLPIRKYLQTICDNNETYCSNVTIANTIHSQFAKGDVDAAGLAIAKTAVRAASANNHHGVNSSSGSTRKLDSRIILVSWDHCSLPTLVVRGFGCREDPRCYRCWPDDRFGDVLRLNVSLVTTTRTMTTANTKILLPEEYTVSSTILDMTGEGFPTDHYHEEQCNLDRNSNMTISTTTTTASTSTASSTTTRMSIEKSTLCIQSYCSTRSAAKHLIQCSCWDE